MYSKKINQLATNLNPQSTDLIPIGDALTGQLKTTTFGTIFGTQADGIESGGIVTWTGTGLVFNISACVYYLNGVRYSSPFSTKTLAASDPTNPRIDVFAVDINSQVVVIQGTPSSNPVEPQVNPTTQIQLTNITIFAGATIPNIQSELIYDENVETWTKTNSGFSTVNYANTVAPYTGTKSIKANCLIVNDCILTFTPPSPLDIINYSTFKFAIKLNRPMLSYERIIISFRVNNAYLGPAIFLNGPSWNNPLYGFSYNSTSWQLISIPASLISTTSNNFTSIEFDYQVGQSPAQILNLDRIELQSGVINNIPGPKNFGYVQTTSGTATATVQTDTLTLSSSGLTTLSATGKIVTIATPTPIPSQTGNTGKFLTTNGSVVSWAFPTDTGITSLNGLGATIQTFATGTSGTDFGISSVGSTHTFNLPTSSATNRGALSSADWSTFNGKENVLTFSSPLSRSVNTISIPAATNSVNGYLTSTDWTTFNGKQGAITLTTTGSTGAATFIGNTLNIPNYSSALSGYIPYTGATQSVVLGFNNIFAQNYFIDGSASSGGYLAIKQFNTTSTGSLGYTSIYALAQNSLYIRYSQTDGSQRIAELSSALLLSGVSRQFVFPDKSGTFALTSDIPSVSGYVTGTGTTNYLPKWTSGSALGNSILYDDGTNVGIGTASPDAKLVVSGTGNITTRVISTDNQANVFLQGTFGQFENLAGDLYITNNAPSSSLIFRTGSATERMRITSGGNLLLNSTTDNGNRLQVTGDGSFTGFITSNSYIYAGNGSTQTEIKINSSGGNNQGPFIRFQKAGAAKGYIGTYSAIISGTSDDLTYYATGSQQWMTNNSSTIKMTLDSSGNLGLGVTPSAWASDIKAFQFGGNGAIINNSNNASFYIHNAYYDTSWKYITSSQQSSYYSQINGIHSWHNAPSGTAGNAITFTQAMTLDASGRLGIGTASPSYVLDVISRTSGEGGVRFWNNRASTSTVDSIALNLHVSNSIGQTGGKIVVAENTTDSWLTNMQFFVNGASSSYSPIEAMRITSGGNLLVGTTTDAGHTLNVNGTIRGTSSITGAQFYASNTNGLSLSDNAVGGFLSYGYNSSRTNAAGHYFYNGITTEIMRLNSSGNLLIGTTVDSGQKLRVSGDGYFTGSVTAETNNGTIIISPTGWRDPLRASILLRTKTNDAAELDFQNTISGLNYGWQISSRESTTPSLIFFSNINGTFSSRLTLTSTGAATFSSSVTAGGLLSVNGDATLVANFNYSSSGTYVRWQNNGTSFGDVGSAGQLVSGGSTNDFAIHARNTYNMVFATNFTERMRITSGGNLLIGTTTDAGQKLQVSGSARFLNNSEVLKLISSNANGNYISFEDNANSYGFVGSNYHLFSGVGSATDLGVRCQNNLIFLSGGANERLRIKSIGSVRYIPMATPASAEAGDVYYDSTTNKLRCYNGTIWNDLF